MWVRSFSISFMILSIERLPCWLTIIHFPWGQSFKHHVPCTILNFNWSYYMKQTKSSFFNIAFLNKRPVYQYVWTDFSEQISMHTFLMKYFAAIQKDILNMSFNTDQIGLKKKLNWKRQKKTIGLRDMSLSYQHEKTSKGILSRKVMVIKWWNIYGCLANTTGQIRIYNQQILCAYDFSFNYPLCNAIWVPFQFQYVYCFL